MIESSEQHKTIRYLEYFALNSIKVKEFFAELCVPFIVIQAEK